MQIIALVILTAYFMYRNKTGWMEISMSMDIETERIHDPNNVNDDILAIKVNFKNGNYGSIRLTDAIAAISYDATTEAVPKVNELDGLVRYDYKGWKIIHGKPHPKISTSGLGPEQEVELSTYFKVPRDAICNVDVTILAKRARLDYHPNESRSSTVSLPLKTEKPKS